MYAPKLVNFFNNLLSRHFLEFAAFKCVQADIAKFKSVSHTFFLHRFVAIFIFSLSFSPVPPYSSTRDIPLFKSICAVLQSFLSAEYIFQLIAMSIFEAILSYIRFIVVVFCQLFVRVCFPSPSMYHACSHVFFARSEDYPAPLIGHLGRYDIILNLFFLFVPSRWDTISGPARLLGT